MTEFALNQTLYAARQPVCRVCFRAQPLENFLHSAREFPKRNPVRNVCRQCLREKPEESRRFYIGNRPTALANYAAARLARRLIYGLLMDEYKKTKKEVIKMSVKSQAKQFYELPDKIAAILGKTYQIRGDDPKTIPDDEAIQRIRDLLDQLDPTLIERNKNKRLSR